MSVKNLVQCPLITPVSSTATELLLGAVSAPYSLPPLDGGILVIADSPSKPSFVEFITYTHRIDNVLYGVSRGQEETPARDWTGVTYVYQALTADQYTRELESKVDKATGQSLMTDAERTKLDGIQAGAQVNSVTSVAGKTGAVSLTKADVGLGNVDNTSDASKPVSTAQQTALNAKAPLESPVFTGSPKAPTPLTTDNSTLLATTAFVKAVVAALVDSSPATLDTLNELAAALGDDPNFATTMTNALALKAPLASPALTGNPTAPTPAAEDSDTSIATTAFVRAAMALFGIGTDAVATVADLDALVTTGLYKFTIPTAGGPGFNYGTLINISRAANGNEITQFALSVTTDQAKFRRKVSGTWSTWQEIWHTGNLAKQTSPTDTTGGALMAVGAGGWLGRADYDSYIAGYPTSVAENISQIYRRETETSDGLPAHSARIHIAAVDTWGRLSISHTSNNKRVFIAGGAIQWPGYEWTAELFHTGNILGTVSQSGGVPTGAIIERGSNANGEYVRFADGTQICWATTPSMSPTTTGERTETFPAAFASVPVVNITPGPGVARFASVEANDVVYGLTTTSLVIASGRGASTTFMYTAIGRWY